MTQEQPLCRFCLDTANEKTDPLIDPCACRGSLRFVHAGCLSRWRRINPVRNANICLLCFTSYNTAHEDSLETIPDLQTIPIFFLRYPFFLCISVHYVGVLFYSVSASSIRYRSIFEVQQYMYQLLYLCLFFFNFQVRNKKLYLIHVLEPSTLLLISIIILSNIYIRVLDYMSAVPITVSFGILYMHHIHILCEMNMR